MPIGGTAFMGMNQHPRLTTTYLNQLNRHGDPGPGVNLGGAVDMVNGGTIGFSGGIVQPYSGFCGGKTTITGPWAAQFADPAVGPLYGGVVQYVQFDPAMPFPATPGAFVWWSDEGNYVVTTGYDANLAYKPAGVIINPTYPSNWDFIYIAGIAMAQFAAAVALGGPVFALQTAGGPSFAGAGTAGGSNTAGVAVMVAGASGVKSPVELNLTAGWNY